MKPIGGNYKQTSGDMEDISQRPSWSSRDENYEVWD